MDTTDTLLSVDGMTCPSCIHHISTALKDVDGVDQVEVKLREGKVVVKHVAGVKIVSLVSALRDAGYESRAA
ncbi:MAG: heavy metal-associated domain-containing protein [Archangium sp.]|nr:heavy metal-associated domain-containing protein [Archangium sp.]MDP3154823.1 heavy metal-associated domain-containing protein [Archangium sp.]MDP3575041.1 heavy metal-associated domain-containing protein [Archangium sp.]